MIIVAIYALAGAAVFCVAMLAILKLIDKITE